MFEFIKKLFTPKHINKPNEKEEVKKSSPSYYSPLPNRMEEKKKRINGSSPRNTGYFSPSTTDDSSFTSSWDSSNYSSSSNDCSSSSSSDSGCSSD